MGNEKDQEIKELREKIKNIEKEREREKIEAEESRVAGEHLACLNLILAAIVGLCVYFRYEIADFFKRLI